MRNTEEKDPKTSHGTSPCKKRRREICEQPENVGKELRLVTSVKMTGWCRQLLVNRTRSVELGLSWQKVQAEIDLNLLTIYGTVYGKFVLRYIPYRYCTVPNK
jgi:hypothetical protein